MLLVDGQCPLAAAGMRNREYIDDVAVGTTAEAVSFAFELNIIDLPAILFLSGIGFTDKQVE